MIYYLVGFDGDTCWGEKLFERDTVEGCSKLDSFRIVFEALKQYLEETP